MQLNYYPVLDHKRENAVEIQNKIQKDQENQNKVFWNIVENFKDSNTVIVWWWDGFMLDSIKKYYDFDKRNEDNPIFFGINCGTLWFLLNDIEIENLPKNLDEIHIAEINPIQVQITTNDGKKIINYALNDIVIGGNIWDYFSYIVKWETFSTNIMWTGLIFSTPIGTTAYRLNAGWPLLPVKCNLWWMMWIASKPFHYKTFSKQTVEIIMTWRNNFSCFVDGYWWKVDNIKKIEIKKTDHLIKLWFIENFETKRVLLAEQKI